MQIILLKRIARLGKLGDIVNVKNGFARNFLLPKKKALRATEANKAIFESQRYELEAKNQESKVHAEKTAEVLNDRIFVVVRSAGESGHLYGSVTTKDIAEILANEGFEVARTQIALNNPLKTIGLHNLNIALHSDVVVNIVVNIARSVEEAANQLAKENNIANSEVTEDIIEDIALEEIQE